MKKYNATKKKVRMRCKYWMAMALSVILLGNSTCMTIQAQETETQTPLEEENEEEMEAPEAETQEKEEAHTEESERTEETERVEESARIEEPERMQDKEAEEDSEPEKTGKQREKVREKAATPFAYASTGTLEAIGDTVVLGSGKSGEYTLPAGDYTIKVAGAGGAASNADVYLSGGNGGLVTGRFHFDKETVLSYVVGTGGSCASDSWKQSGGTPGGGRGYLADDEKEIASGGGGGYSAIMLKGEYLLIAGGGAGADSDAKNGGHAGEDGGTGGGQSGMTGANGERVTVNGDTYATGGGGGGYRGGKSHTGGTSHVSSKGTATQLLTGKGSQGGKSRAAAGEGGKIEITWNACRHEQKKLTYISLDDYCNHKVVCSVCKSEVERITCSDDDENGFCDICNQLVSPYFKEDSGTECAFTYDTEGESVFRVKPEKVDGFHQSLQWYCKKDGIMEQLDEENRETLVIQNASLDAGRYEYFCMLSYDGHTVGSKQSASHIIEVGKAEGSITFDTSDKQVTLYKTYPDGDNRQERKISFSYNASGKAHGKGNIQLLIPEPGLVKGRVQAADSSLTIQALKPGKQEIVLRATEGLNYTACEQKLSVEVLASARTGNVLWDFTEEKKDSLSITKVHKEDNSKLPQKLTVPDILLVDGEKKEWQVIKTNTFPADCGTSELIIPENIITIEQGAVADNIRIITVPGSAAEAYARENGNPLTIKTDGYSYDVIKKDNTWVADNYVPVHTDGTVTIPEKADTYPVIKIGDDAISEKTEQIIVKGPQTQFPQNPSCKKDIDIIVIKDSLTEESAMNNGFSRLQYLALGGIEVRLAADSMTVTGTRLDTSQIVTIGYWDKERTQSSVIPWDKLTTVPKDLTVYYQGINKYVIGYYDAFTSFIINGYAPHQTGGKTDDKVQNKPQSSGGHHHSKPPARDTERMKEHFEEVLSGVTIDDIQKLIDTDTVHLSKDIVEKIYESGMDRLDEISKNKLYQSELSQITSEDIGHILQEMEEGLSTSPEVHSLLETIEEKAGDYNEAYHNIIDSERSLKKKIVVIQSTILALLFIVVHISIRRKRGRKGERWNESESNI